MKKGLILFSLSICATLIAQTLTLQESIDKTLSNHPDIKSFKLKIEQSHAGYKATYADYLPQVDLQANYNVIQTFVFPVNGSFNTENDNGWNAGVSVKQKIWDFEKTSSKIDASKIDEKISKLSLDDLKSLLVYKVKSLYALMVVQKDAIKVRQKDLESKKAYYKQALALVENGLKTKADASRFLSSVYIAQDNLAIANASYKKAKQTLSLYMGETISKDVELQSFILKQNFEEDNNLIQEIMQSNYQIKIYSDTIEKNKLIHKSTKASHFGSIDAIGSYTHIDTLNSYDSKVAGVTLNIPLYSGGRLSAEVQKAKISQQIATEQKASKLLSIIDEANSLMIDIKRYENTISAKKAQLKSAMSTKDVLEGRYKEGLSTYIEVLDATSLVLNAELGLLEAEYQKSMAINQIEYLKGKIL